jgi:AcrR family transcriptional regulator
MAEIARLAGVGMTTLYRNFPGRLELIEELYRSVIDDICRRCEGAYRRDPGESFFGWRAQFHAAGTRKGPLASLLLSGADGESPC